MPYRIVVVSHAAVDENRVWWLTLVGTGIVFVSAKTWQSKAAAEAAKEMVEKELHKGAWK